MLQVVATVERVGPLRAQLYVKVPRFLVFELKDLPFGVRKGDQVELVLKQVDSQQRGLEEAA